MIDFDDIITDIKELLKNENGSQISKNTGIPYQTVQDLRNAKTSLESARFNTIRKLYEYAKLR